VRAPVPVVAPFVPFADAVLGGCLKLGGGRFELKDGEGDDCEDFAPCTDVCTIGGGGRFILGGPGTGLAATAVAIERGLMLSCGQLRERAISYQYVRPGCGM